MRTLIALIASAAVMAGSAAAQDAEPPRLPVVVIGQSAGEDDAAERMALAERYVELSQGDNMRELVDTYVGQILDAQTGADPAHLEWFRRTLPSEIGNMTTMMMDGLTPIFAERLTLEELEALVAFYETPVGRSISQKQMEIGVEQGAAMQGIIERFQVSLMVKFCTVFDCATGARIQPQGTGKRTP